MAKPIASHEDKRENPSPATHSVESGKAYPGERDESATVKNPKTPETSGKTDADRVVDRAAHKAAHDQNQAEKEKELFTH